jgi:hypothetical protein
MLIRSKVLLVAALLLPATGCVVLEKQLRPQTTARSCGPSQHWDGSQCRHNGNGHGARKHDGDGAGPGKSKGKKG